MKHFTKLLAVILVCVIALSTAACSLTPQWSYKTEDTEYAIGVYIYALYTAYSEAQTLAQETDVYDSETGEYDGDTSFLNVQITDEDGVTATADQWIVDKADETIRTMLAIEHEFNRLGATVDQATMTNYTNAAKESWDYGPYAMYGEQYINPYSDVFEPLGISYESFEYYYIITAKQQAVFDALYAVDGEQGVSDKELTKYFEENYTSYTYFNTNLYETKDTTNDDGETVSENIPFNEKKTTENKDRFNGYADSVNSGTKVSDVVDKFVKDYDLESDTSTSSVEIMSDSTIGKDLVDAIDALKEGKATSKVIGTEETPVLYFFYKQPISEQVDEYIGNADNRASVLQSYKAEDFDSYIDSVAQTLDITVSKACNKYSPKIFED